MNLWQGIAGGEESGESFLEAAQRETFEERVKNIQTRHSFLQLA